MIEVLSGSRCGTRRGYVVLPLGSECIDFARAMVVRLLPILPIWQHGRS